MEPVRPHLVVVGLIAAGKSTVAARVADRLGRTHLDSDHQIEALTGRSGGAIATSDGVEALHELEASVLLGALSLDEGAVVSTAASTIESPGCRAAMRRRAVVVWLDLPAEVAHQRATVQSHRRPIDLTDLVDLAARRRDRFAEVADLRLDANRPVVELVGAALAVAPASPS